MSTGTVNVRHLSSFFNVSSPVVKGILVELEKEKIITQLGNGKGNGRYKVNPIWTSKTPSKTPPNITTVEEEESYTRLDNEYKLMDLHDDVETFDDSQCSTSRYFKETTSKFKPLALRSSALCKRKRLQNEKQRMISESMNDDVYSQSSTLSLEGEKCSVIAKPIRQGLRRRR